MEERLEKIREEEKRIELARQMDKKIGNYYTNKCEKIEDTVNLLEDREIKETIRLAAYSKKECLEKELAIKLDFDFKEEYLSETDFKDKLLLHPICN